MGKSRESQGEPGRKENSHGHFSRLSGSPVPASGGILGVGAEWRGLSPIMQSHDEVLQSLAKPAGNLHIEVSPSAGAASNHCRYPRGGIRESHCLPAIRAAGNI